MGDQETLNVYAQKAQDYVQMTETACKEDVLLAQFIAVFPKGAHVLDLGCGPGTSAHCMADAGLKVTALDAVPEMIVMADTHPGVTARVAHFDEIDDKSKYDGIWCNYSLLHAARADMPRHLAALHKALKPGGLFHIALKSGTGEKRDRLGRLYTYYTLPELTGLLEAAGFTPSYQTEGAGKGLDGTMANWIAIRAHG